MSKKILGLDLGTNSIGWALIQQDFENKQGKILGMGSRIIPMDAAIMEDFDKGNSVSQTADRTKYRSARRLRERHLLRRERLHRVLNVLGFLPEHYAKEIDFEKRLGQFIEGAEPKIVWKKNGKKENGKDKFEFLFQDLFNEMLADFRQCQPEMLNCKNKKGEDAKIPYDWSIYYLRKKALEKAITKEQLAWLILNFNQKRGYYQLRGEEEEENPNKLVEFHSLKVVDIKPEIKYNLVLENGKMYYRTSEISLLDWKDTYQDFIVTKYLDNAGKEKQSFILKEDIGFLKSKKTKSSKKKANETVEEQSIKIIEVKEEKQNKIWYSAVLENGWIYRRESAIDLSDWKDKVREFIVTTDLEDDETGEKTVAKDKDGKEKRSFRAPKEDDWALIKKKTEQDIDQSKKSVGTYIYDTLLKNPTQKINGKLVRTIERKFYKDELEQILQKQIELQPELFTDELYNDCVRELYRSNELHQQSLSKRDFVHLFLDDIIFYQRPLKSQKSSIGNCSLEFHKYINKDGKEVTAYLKAIPKSNPYYQEFRIWQWLYNLKTYLKEDNTNITTDFLNSAEDYERLFEFLNNRKEIEQKPLIKFLVEQKALRNETGLKGKALTAETEKYRWNYVEDKKYPCNETGTQIRTHLEKVANLPDDFLTREIEQQLWHIIYSVTDKNEFETALETFAKKHDLYYVPKEKRDSKSPDKNCFVENFRKFPPFKSDYGTFSEKAIKKLLPLMRFGKSWNWENIQQGSKDKIEKIITGEYDENIKNKVREFAEKHRLVTENDFQGLPLWLAQYIVYGRHSEAAFSGKWNSVKDLEKYLKEFKQHSLRNPIVEQVITETLRVVKDIWAKYGNEAKDYFSEIHIELGREMKQTKDERDRATKKITENENTNLRIKALLAELALDRDVENVRPYSPMQQEILKIYEDGALSSDAEIEEDILKISKAAQPSKSELIRYKLWLEQRYRSPYTGQIIPLNKLFTQEYEIEHIIPQGRYFDDGFNNKVICEAEVNKLKDKQLGFEFIKNHHGYKVSDRISILEVADYEEFVKQNYAKNRAKRNKLLMEDIPEKMIERQLNDTRYISKFITSVLSNIVRADKDDDGVNSKNIVPGNGKITSALRQDWGLNEVWNELILPRFERMNALNEAKRNELIKELDNKEKEFPNKRTDIERDKNEIEDNNEIDNGEKAKRLEELDKRLLNLKNKIDKLKSDIQLTIFTAKNKEGHTIPAIPLELSRGFQKKRIDHRHHAMDALVIACATRDHINLLNNQSAKSDNSRYDLQNKLRNKEKWQDKNGKERDKFTDFKKPWENFPVNAKDELEKIVVSFKQNLRVINKATNHYEKIENGKKVEVEQKGTNWAIRQPLHEETVSGIVNLPWVQLGKGEMTTATRERNDLVSIFKDVKTNDKAEKKIRKITDTGIQKILFRYLKSKDNNPEVTFSPEGIEELNKNISQFNNGKFHQPIFKVRVYEKGSGRFKLGIKGNKKDKYVQGAPNLFFGIYLDNEGNRSFETIPLDKVIERLKQKISPVPEKKTIKKKKEIHELNLLFHLSPDDLVYVPTEDEKENRNTIDFSNLTKEQMKRIFFVNDFSGSTCYFRPNRIAKAIVEKEVDMNYDEKKNKITGSFDTKTASFEGEQIKNICLKLKIDRLGNISKA